MAAGAQADAAGQSNTVLRVLLRLLHVAQEAADSTPLLSALARAHSALTAEPAGCFEYPSQSTMFRSMP